MEIDFRLVAVNALWILGPALLLATVSWTYWAAQEERLCFWEAARRPASRWAAGAGLTLFCAGLAATASHRWEQILWALLALVLGISVAGAGIIPRRKRP